MADCKRKMWRYDSLFVSGRANAVLLLFLSKTMEFTIGRQSFKFSFKVCLIIKPNPLIDVGLLSSYEIITRALKLKFLYKKSVCFRFPQIISPTASKGFILWNKCSILREAIIYVWEQRNLDKQGLWKYNTHVSFLKKVTSNISAAWEMNEPFKSVFL